MHLVRETQLQPSGQFQAWELGTTIEYALAALGREANPGETFTISGTTYTVRAVEKNDGFACKVVVT